jgi:hypothetical protein
MPIDKTINQPDGADSLGPKPPTNPVEFARWVQRPRVNPKKPKVRPDDSALLPEPLEKPEVNRSIGTDKPKLPNRKNPNNTRLPEYLRPNDGLKSAPVAKDAGGLRDFLHWSDVTIGDSLDLRKMSPATLAAFGLGWYVSDTLTRDEKQKWQRQMEEEFNRSIKNQDDDRKARELECSGRRLRKSAFDELQEHYQGHIS